MSQALPDVCKILALRPNALGDFAYALPALHALKAAYPDAELVFVGKQWHAEFLHARPGPIDRVVVIPPVAGVGEPPDAVADPEPVERFVEAMRAVRFDLAVQMFGGGRYSNPFIMQLGARLTIGARAAGAGALDRWVRFGDINNRRLELLEVAALAGAPPAMPERELMVTERDRAEAARVLPPAPGQPLVVLQPGASDPRRRWPAACFAAVADALAQEGAQVVVNGTAAEAPLTRAVVAQMRHPAADLSGRLSLSCLCGLLERAALLVSNDTGPLHLGLAIGTPCVGIYWLTNLLQAAPLRQHRHRAALSLRVRCPVCGEENIATRCPHDACFVDDVLPEEVTRMALELLRAGR